jgi:hypothetical protein
MSMALTGSGRQNIDASLQAGFATLTEPTSPGAATGIFGQQIQFEIRPPPCADLVAHPRHRRRRGRPSVWIACRGRAFPPYRGGLRVEAKQPCSCVDPAGGDHGQEVALASGRHACGDVHERCRRAARGRHTRGGRAEGEPSRQYLAQEGEAGLEAFRTNSSEYVWKDSNIRRSSRGEHGRGGAA